MVDNFKKLAAATRYLRKRAIAVFLLAVMCAGTVFAAASTSYTVTVFDDTEEITLVTTRTSAEGVLSQAELALCEGDVLNTDDFQPGKDSTIRIYRLHSVTVYDGSGNPTELKIAGTVADAIEKAGVTLGGEEKLNFDSSAPLSENMTIRILREVNVKISHDGEITSGKVLAATVADALSIMGIALGENDETVPAANTQLMGDTEITVNRVTYSERTVNEIVAFDVEKQYSSAMFENESVTVRSGAAGERKVTYRDKVVNGAVVSSEEVTSEVITAPVNEIRKIGTKKRNTAIKLTANKPISGFATPDWIEFGENGLPTNYKSIIEGKAAAYTGGGTTSTGKKAQPGYIAVDPKQIPYGTKMWIVSLDGKFVYGYCIAADTGGFVAKKTFTCDLYMNTLEECYQWGARYVRIYIF